MNPVRIAGVARTHGAWLLIGIALGLLLELPVPALADGCFVWRHQDQDIREPEQKCLIVHAQGRQDMVLSVRFEGAARDFGWIVPVPAEPELHPEQDMLFEFLSRATQRRYARRARGRESKALAAGHSLELVQILREQRVGIYDATVLTASDAEALDTWLREHQFHLSSAAAPVLESYIARGWVFVAFKIDPEAFGERTAEQLYDGTIQPVRFRFATEEPVFPLEISALGAGPADVLIYMLAQEVLVPRSPLPHVWSQQIKADPGGHHWIYQYESEAETKRFLPHYEEPYYLTKCRARLAPEQMTDVYFSRYDPARGLRSTQSQERIDALFYLAHHRPANGAELLVTMHERISAGGELYAYLWALGQVGGPRAERLLMGHLRDRDDSARLEAIYALTEMGSRRAADEILPLLTMEDVRRWPSWRGWLSPKGETRPLARQFREAAWHYIARNAGPWLADDVRAISQRYGGAARWAKLGTLDRGYACDARFHRGRPYDAGLLAHLGLACCGDSSATRMIVDAIVDGGEVTARDELRKLSGSRGRLNGQPLVLWPVHTVLGHTDSQRRWPALCTLTEFLEAHPAQRGRFLKAAAEGGRGTIPLAGLAMLHGLCEELDDTQCNELWRLWQSAIERPERIEVYDVRCGWHRRRSDDPDLVALFGTVAYNVPACCVVHAFQQHGRVDWLQRLLDTAPVADHTLRGEILGALARTHRRELIPEIWNYARDVWQPISDAAAMRAHLALIEDVEDQLHALRRLPVDDNTLRFSWLTRHLARHLWQQPAREVAAEIERCAPVLRLALLSQLYRSGNAGSDHHAAIVSVLDRTQHELRRVAPELEPAAVKLRLRYERAPD